jgi:hypothetical protein
VTVTLLVGVVFGDASRTVCVLTWESHEYHLTGLGAVSGITTEYECMKACEENADCSNVEFDSASNTCWHGNEENPTGKTTHWDLTRVCKECPEGFQYSQTLNFCYRIVTQKQNWNNAGAGCRSLHPTATLVVINNTQEQDVLKSAIKALSAAELKSCELASKQTEFFTAGQRKEQQNCKSPFVWKAGSGIPETDVRDVNWNTNEPNCSGGNENCVGIYLNFNNTLNDISCDYTFCYICQVPMA